tara:strand:+ start:1774 stop:1998 length:225 start_codon:yes stop_codon:yes gene_type:complete
MTYNEKYYNGRSVDGSLRIIGSGTTITTGIGTTSNSGYSVDGTLGDWEIIGGETELYVLNHSNNKKYKLSMEEI